MVEQVRIIQEALRQAVTNPTADPVVTAFALTAIVLGMLILVLGVLLLLTPKRRRVMKVRRRRPAASSSADEDSGGKAAPAAAGTAAVAAAAREPAQAEATSPESASESASVSAADAAGDPGDTQKSGPGWATRLTSWGAIAALVVIALVVGYVATGTDQFCATMCHGQSEQVVEAVDIDHARCVSCHEYGGLAGVFANSASRTRMAVAYATGTRPGGEAVVASQPCLGCHDSILDEVVESGSGVRMSHRETNDGGMTCTFCHSVTGHSVRRDYSMSTCLPCHDGTWASADCEVCHSRDPYEIPPDGGVESTQTLGSGDVVYPVTFIDEKTCGGCHNQPTSCDPCHGLRMPHTEAFVNSGHAPSAAFERKEMCFRCHDEAADCTSGCHQSFDSHSPGWKQEHKSSPWDAGCVCHQTMSGREGPMCPLCH